jgi:hypothetical protein
MELVYCYKCGFRIAEQDLAHARTVRIDEKVFCPKCAPPPLPSLNPVPVPSVAKKKSGSPSISGMDAAPKRHSTGTLPAPDSRRNTPQTTTPRSGNMAIPIAAGAGVCALVLGLVFMMGGSDSGAKKVAVPNPNPAPAPTPAPQVHADPTPNPAHAPLVYEQPSNVASPLQRAASKDDPEKVASDTLDKVRKFEGVAENNKAERIKRLEDFIARFPDSIAAARANRMVIDMRQGDEAPTQIPHSIATTPKPALPPEAGEFAGKTNYALATNGATARGENAKEMIDGNSTRYDYYSGYAQMPIGDSLVVVLKEPTELDCIRFLLWDREDRFYRYRLDVCADDLEKAWVSIADKSDSNSQCKSWQTLRFASRKVKVIRVTGTFNSANNALHIVELQAFKLGAADAETKLETLRVPIKAPTSTGQTLLSESFDGPTCEGMSFGELVDGPAGSHGKVWLLKGNEGWAKAAISTWAKRGSDKRKYDFAFLDNTVVRFRYFIVNAQDLRLLIKVVGQDKIYEHPVDVAQKNAWISVEVPLAEILQVDTGEKLKPGAVFDEIRFTTWGNADLTVYIDDLWIGVQGKALPEPTVPSHSPVAISGAGNGGGDKYDDFLEDYRSALRKHDKAAAAALLKSANFPDKQQELAQDAGAVAWLDDLDAALLKGAEKLKDVDSFELRPEKGAPLTVGKHARYHLDEIKNGMLYAANDSARLPVSLAALEAESRDQLTQLGLDADGKGSLLRAEIAVLKLDAKAAPYQIAAVRAALDKAKAAGAGPELVVVRRQLDAYLSKSQQLEKQDGDSAKQELAAAHDWIVITQLCDNKKWEQVRTALVAFEEKFGATPIGARRAEEIKALQLKCIEAPLANGLVGYWKFDEGKGNATVDSSGNHNNGTIVGADWVQGREGSGLSFNGAEDFVDIPDKPSLHVSDALSISLWFKNMGKTRDWGRLISKGWPKYEAPWSSFALTMDNGAEGNQKMGFSTAASADKASGVGSKSAFPITGQWHHVVGVYDGAKSRIAIYVDGVKEDEQQAANATITATNVGVRIGDDPTTKEKHKCIIDEVRIYNRPLSDAEVKSLFNLYK